jgi:hypothetical protein
VAIECSDAQYSGAAALGVGEDGARANRAFVSSTSAFTVSRFEGVSYEKLRHGSEREKNSGEGEELHCAFDLKFSNCFRLVHPACF